MPLRLITGFRPNDIHVDVRVEASECWILTLGALTAASLTIYRQKWGAWRHLGDGFGCNDCSISIYVLPRLQHLNGFGIKPWWRSIYPFACESRFLFLGVVQECAITRNVPKLDTSFQLSRFEQAFEYYSAVIWNLFLLSPYQIADKSICLVGSLSLKTCHPPLPYCHFVLCWPLTPFCPHPH